MLVRSGTWPRSPTPTPNLPFLFLFVPTGHIRRGTRDLLTFAGTRATAMMRFIFSLEPSRDPWHTARLRAVPGPPPAWAWVDMQLAMGDDYKRILELRERRPCPIPWGWARGAPVDLTLTASAPEFPRDLVAVLLCVSFHVNKKAQS